MKIFAISGLGADERVFRFLTLRHELIPITWITPKPTETIIDYSQRLIIEYGIDKENEFGVLGVSFGGLIATEISKIIKPTFTILISTVETRSELGIFLRLAGTLKIVKLIPKKLLNPPRPLAHFIFGTEKKQLLNSILDDTDLTFAKWAINQLLTWENQTRLPNLIKIGGSKDKLLPPKGENTILIDQGEHFMIVDKANEIGLIINEQIKQFNSKS